MRWSLAIDQPVQNVEDVGLGRHPSFEGQLDGAEHSLFVMLQNQREDLDHLPVTTGPLEQMALQLPERIGHLEERRPIAQGARLALDHCQIVPPVIDRPPRQVVRTVDNPRMLAQDLPLGGDDDPIGIDPQAHGRLAKDAGTL
jgi:hypothetical protein